MVLAHQPISRYPKLVPFRIAHTPREHSLVNTFRSFKRINQVEVGLALAALLIALVAGIYLVVTTFAEHETCYGISASKVVCHPLTSDTLAQTSGRIAIILSIVLVLYAAGAAAAWWQSRTRQPDARSTAYMALLTSALTVLAIALPALEGVGIFFLPSSLLLLIAAIVGLPALLQAKRLDAPRTTPTTAASQTIETNNEIPSTNR